MKQELPIRINVLRPLAGVAMLVQRGKDEFLQPVRSTTEIMTFEFDVSVDISATAPNFLGRNVHGPKGDRFIYVNSGKYAGQEETCWARRAKISLMNISDKQIRRVLDSKGARLEVSFNGTGSDAGPTCASIKPPPAWKVVPK